MSVHEFPLALNPSSLRFWLRPNALLSASPINRAQQAAEREGATWVCEMRFETLGEIKAGALEALLAKLNGPVHELRLWDFRRPFPNGTAAVWPGGAAALIWPVGLDWPVGLAWAGVTPPTTPQVRAAAGQGATTLQTWGWAAGSLVLRAGDRIGLDGRLHMVTDDATTDTAGMVALNIMPPLRAAVAAETVIVTTRPTARFRLVDNDQAANSIRPGRLTQIAIQLVESLP